jgi:hypothetical protein
MTEHVFPSNEDDYLAYRGLDQIFDENICGEHPEHDWQLFDEADGERMYHCRRCGAEVDPEVIDD